MNSTLKALDFQVCSLLRSGNFAPNIGLIPIEGKKRFTDSLIHFLDGKPNRLRHAFRDYPYATTWIICQIIWEHYGENNKYEFFPTLERKLEFHTPFKQHTMKMLHNGFFDLCEKLGINYEHYGRPIDICFAHTGVTKIMLGHLAEAFLRQEMEDGLPNTDNTRELLDWEEGASDFLTYGVSTVQHPLKLDDTGWHATLFTKIRNGESAGDGQYEKSFAQKIEETLESAFRTKRSAEAFQRPRLMWDESGLFLDVPKIEGRMTLRHEYTGLKGLKLPGEQPTPISPPWPKLLEWETSGKQKGKIEFLDDSTCLEIFDQGTGRKIKSVKWKDEQAFVESLEFVLVSRQLFSVNGEEAIMFSENAYCVYQSINKDGCEIEFNDHRLELSLRYMKRITISSGLLAKSRKNLLCGGETEFAIDGGGRKSETLSLNFHGGGRSGNLMVELDDSGLGTVWIDSILDQLNSEGGSPLSDPFKLNIEMTSIVGDGEFQKGKSYKSVFFVWPGAVLSEDGMLIENVEAPGSMNMERCRHLVLDNDRRVCLDRYGGYAKANLAFDIDNEGVDFQLPFPGVICKHQAIDGRTKFLVLGSQVILREENRNDIIVIQCRERDRDLIVRGEREVKPFRKANLRQISFRQLLESGGNDRIELCGESTSQILLRVVESVAPEIFNITTNNEIVEFELETKEIVDAVMLTLEDELGENSEAFFQLGRIPVEEAAPDWLHAEYDFENPHRIKVKIDQTELQTGICLAQISVRFDGSDSFEKISDGQHHEYAIAIKHIKTWGKDKETSPSISIPEEKRFESQSKWLTRRFSKESWVQIEPVVLNSWRKLLFELYKSESGKRTILLNSMMEDANENWIPGIHPLVSLPELFGVEPSCFYAFGSSEDEGIRLLSLVADVNTANIKDSERVSHAVKLSFENSIEVNLTGDDLVGFQPQKFLESLTDKNIDDNPSAGVFWTGREILGPGHWRAAHINYISRLERYRLFGDQVMTDETPNGRRQVQLNRVISSCLSNSTLTEAPIPTQIESSDYDESQKNLEQWTATTLLNFAKAARNGKAKEWADMVATITDMSRVQVLSSISLLIRLAPELFAFYMGVWQLSLRFPCENSE